MSTVSSFLFTAGYILGAVWRLARYAPRFGCALVLPKATHAARVLAAESQLVVELNRASAGDLAVRVRDEQGRGANHPSAALRAYPRLAVPPEAGAGARLADALRRVRWDASGQPRPVRDSAPSTGNSVQDSGPPPGSRRARGRGSAVGRLTPGARCVVLGATRRFTKGGEPIWARVAFVSSRWSWQCW